MPSNGELNKSSKGVKQLLSILQNFGKHYSTVEVILFLRLLFLLIFMNLLLHDFIKLNRNLHLKSQQLPLTCQNRSLYGNRPCLIKSPI